MLPKLEQWTALVEKIAGRAREQDLAAVRSGGNTSGEMNVLARVALLSAQRPPRVQADPEMDRPRRQFFGHHAGSLESIGGRGKGDKKGIALRVDLDAASCGTCFSHNAPVGSERLGIRLHAEFVQEPR
jgi:hypothetical protein